MTALLARLCLALGLCHTGRATCFSAAEGAPFNPDPRLYCTGRPLDDRRDIVVAHRTLRCGTHLWIYDPESDRDVVAIVADRGPRRALVDLAPATRRALRHRCSGNVVVAVLP
jgi:hypothetical protein